MRVVLIFFAALVPFTLCLIGGNDVGKITHYFAVSIQDKYKKHICGGTIYEDRFILTAATCLAGMKPNDIFILAGTAKLDEEGIRFKVDRIIRNLEPAGKNGVRNDIAILRLTEKIKESVLTKSIDLPENEEQAEKIKIEQGDFFGWGKSSEKGPQISNNLQYTFFTTEDLKICRVRNSDINETNICTAETRKSLCKFDAGGPLVSRRYDVLWGIATSDQPCHIFGLENSKIGDIYTRVFSYKNWIEDTVRENFGHIGFNSNTTIMMTICGVITLYVLNLIR